MRYCLQTLFQCRAFVRDCPLMATIVTEGSQFLSISCTSSMYSSMHNTKALLSYSRDIAFKFFISVGHLVATDVTKGSQFSCMNCVSSLCSSIPNMKAIHLVIHEILHENHFSVLSTPVVTVACDQIQ